MATFDLDSFTGTTGTLLSAHTPDTGGSWVIATGTSLTAQITSSGRLRSTTAGNEADYLCQGTPATADYAVQADLWGGTATAQKYAGVLARSDASAGQNATTGKAYIGQYDQAALAWTIVKAVNNGFTQVGSSFSSTVATSTTTTFKLTVSGSTTTALVLNVAGTDRVTTTDSTSPITAAGKAGLFVSSATATDGLSIELDNFSASDPVAASTFPPLPAVWHSPLLPM